MAINFKTHRWIFIFILMILILSGCTQESNTEEPDIYTPECTVQELIQAIDDANADGVPSEIQLIEDCVYTLTHVENSFTWNSMTINNGLPRITSEITIRGNNAVIEINPASGEQPFGHFFLAKDQKLMLYDLTLSDGVRPVGGSVINDKGDLLVHNVNFFDNRALPFGGTVTGQGGAIFNYSGKLRILAGSFFRNNMAGDTIEASPHAGGAVFSINSSLTIYTSYFYENFAAGNGGAIYTIRVPGLSGGELITVQNTEFSQNTANTNGGAVYLKGENSGSFIVSSFFFENDAYELGGAIYSEDSNLNADFTNFFGNLADAGGAIYTRRTVNGGVSSFDSDHSLYSDNSAVSNGGAVFSENSDVKMDDTEIYFSEAASCGGLQLGGSLALDVAAGDLETAPIINSNSRISGSIISANQALNGFGGGICHLMGELVIDDSEISENHTPSYGGGLLSMDSLEVMNSDFSGNHAYRGGGLAIGHPLELNSTLSPAYLNFYSSLSQSLVSDNVTSSEGGGIWVHNGGSLHINKSTISGNTAAEDGGGIFLQEGFLGLENSTLANNTAFRGGGIYDVGDNSDLTLTHTTVAYNTATDGGNGSRPGGGGINAKKLIYMRQVLVVLNTNEDCSYGPISVTGGSGPIFGDKYTLTLTNGVDSDGSCIILETENNPQIGGFNGAFVPIQGGSPLIDRIGAMCYSSTDQIGTPRDPYSYCEPGSIEYNAAAPPPPPPAAPDPSGETEDCDPFAGLEISVNLLGINPDTMALPVYLRFSEELPDLGDGIMPYYGTLGGLESTLCNQQGFPDRLYCMFTLQPDYPGTLRDLTYFKEDCSEPVFTQPGLTIPDMPGDDQPGLSCNKDLGETACTEAGGTWFTGVDDPFCLCP